MRIAVTADLHWGHHAVGNAATELLCEHLRAEPPDLFLLGGDVGTGDHFASCLELFRDLPCPKALVPGNHDLWVEDDDPRGDSLQVYDSHLPALCANAGFHYLDQAPLILPDRTLAVVGTINWYDYSWSLERLKREVPDWEFRLQRMAFTRGRHNDRRFVQWALDDVSFTRRVVSTFEAHLSQALTQVERVIVLTHHPACYGLNFLRDGPPSVPDGLLWDAFSGNTLLEDVLRRHADRIAMIFSGHTHRARQNRFESVPAYNLGGDYSFKRMMTVDWPGGEVQSHQFGNG